MHTKINSTCAIIVCSAIQSPKSKDKYPGVVFNWIIIRICMCLEICKAGITILHIKSTEARERWLWEGFLEIYTPKSTQCVQWLCAVSSVLCFAKVNKAKTNTVAATFDAFVTTSSSSTWTATATSTAWYYANLALVLYTLKAPRQGHGGTPTSTPSVEWWCAVSYTWNMQIYREYSIKAPETGSFDLWMGTDAKNTDNSFFGPAHCLLDSQWLEVSNLTQPSSHPCQCSCTSQINFKLIFFEAVGDEMLRNMKTAFESKTRLVCVEQVHESNHWSTERERVRPQSSCTFWNLCF